MKAYSDGVKRLNKRQGFRIGVLKNYMREQDPQMLETTYKFWRRPEMFSVRAL
jgi:hypothetical protein